MSCNHEFDFKRFCIHCKKSAIQIDAEIRKSLNQSDIFYEYEGDNYITRNFEKSTHFNPYLDFPVKLINMYQIKATRVLEVGCCFGARLAYLQKYYECECMGVDASKQGIETAIIMHPKVLFEHAKASEFKLPRHADKYDLIIVNFLFHWIAREELAETVERIDLSLKEGGYLIIGDFAPKEPMITPYHHIEGIYTYKEDYSKLFDYTELAYLTTSHERLGMPNVCLDDNERVGCRLLLKGEIKENEQRIENK